jgi:hypothetical protein
MTPMRCAGLFLLLPLAAGAAAGPDALELTQRFAAAGAAHLALARVEQLQPATVTASAWGDWETLRCSLLYETRRHADLLRRVAALPAPAPEKVKRSCLLQGARAAVAASDSAAARDFLTRLIWRHDPAPDELRQWRRLVIDSYVSEGKAHDAYALMLRYQQDYRPIDGEAAARFVEALLAAGMDKEAVGWLSALDDSSPAKALLRLANNLVSPDAAVAQARAQLLKAASPAAWWRVMQQAAVSLKNRALELEALEQMLQLADERAPSRVTTLSTELWTAYLATAQDSANQNQILLGDEAALSDFASRRMSAAPPLGRALFAYLAGRSRNPDTRLAAQLQLVHSLYSGKLGNTAFRLYADPARFPPAQLDAQARYLLGAIAAETNQPASAARFWQGLNTPPTLTADEWQLRLAHVLVRAGAVAEASDALRRVVAGKSVLPADVMRQAVAVAQALQDAGHDKTADELYRAMLPLAEPAQKREILMAAGKIAENGNDFAKAAGCFLEAAVVMDQNSNDAFTWNARLHAALNLDRAGLKDDAGAQFQWLQSNARDAAQREAVRRELARR